MISFSLVLFLIAIFIISYIKINSDVLHPANLLLVGFIIAAICNFIIMMQVHGDITAFTLFLVLMFVVLFVFLSNVGFRYSKLNIEYDTNEFNFINVKYWKVYVVIIFQIIAICCFIFKFKEMLGSIDSATLAKYRMSVLYSSDKKYAMPSWIMTFCNISYIYAYLSLYILINNFCSKIKDKKLNVLLIISVVLSLSVPLIGSSRFDDITLCLYGLALFMFFEMRKSNTVKKSLLISVALVIIAFIGFKTLGIIIGRSNQKLAFVYYFGGGISLFDSYIRNSFELPNGHFGLLTFNNVYKLLNKLHVINFNYNVQVPFRGINGTSIGNVYSCLLSYYRDFGSWGIAILSSVFGFLFGLAYKFVCHIKCQKISLPIIAYFYLSYVLVLSPYSEFISTTLFSAGFYVNMFLIYLMSKFYTIDNFNFSSIHNFYLRIFSMKK